jgi:hypothetical protein
VTIQEPTPDWRTTCRWLWSRCPSRVPSNLLLGATYLGLLGGLALGAVFGAVLAAALGFGIAIIAGAVIGGVFGLVVGMVNGAVLTLLSRTPVLRSRSGVGRNRVTTAATVTTCVTSLGLLYPAFQSSGDVFVYAPVIAATLSAIPMSRKLRLACL